MEVKLSNKIDKTIFVKIANEEDKIPLNAGCEYSFRKDEQKELDIKMFDESQKNLELYKINVSCTVFFESDGVYQLIEDVRNKLNKIENANQENKISDDLKDKIVTIHKEKKFNFNYEQFKKDELLFIDNDVSNIFKLKEVKYLPEQKIELVLIHNGTLEERTFNPFKVSITNLTRIKLNIIHLEDKIFEKYIVININEKMESLYKTIEEKAKSLIIGKNFRIIFKHHDISGKTFNKEFFKDFLESENADVFNTLNDDEKNSCEINKCGIDDILDNKDNTIKIPNEVKVKNFGNTSKQNLVDLKFDFKNDFLTIIVPEIRPKVFSLKDVSEDGISHDYESKKEIDNTFIFSKNIIINNICISSCSNGEFCIQTHPEFDFYIYEIDVDPKDKEIKTDNYSEESNEPKYEDLNSISAKKKISKVIFEKKKNQIRQLHRRS